MKIRHNELLSIEDLRRCVGVWKCSPCARRILIQNHHCVGLGLDCLTCYVHIQNMLKVVCK